MIFSHNCVGIGMCVLFSPFAGAIVMAYFHLFFFMLYCVFEIKLMILPGRVVRIRIKLNNLSNGFVQLNFDTDRSCWY